MIIFQVVILFKQLVNNFITKHHYYSNSYGYTLISDDSIIGFSNYNLIRREGIQTNW